MGARRRPMTQELGTAWDVFPALKPSGKPTPAFRIHCSRQEAVALIPRYTRPEMGRIWSEENRFRTWLAVEVAATETLAEAGLGPKEAARAIPERADFN